ncbi:MAG: hypothetical protein COU27_01775 [Candidatus Levybacteria bacterium CG10_big_fil_rev_8_21_14_0_10_36_7]|nr:MAG: hypothetical protein COU27_01775 [Candidatus Levybacteria bacterium CG10_big_fil_rev_8_21_14_0_10_36_7]
MAITEQQRSEAMGENNPEITQTINNLVDKIFPKELDQNIRDSFSGEMITLLGDIKTISNGRWSKIRTTTDNHDLLINLSGEPIARIMSSRKISDHLGKRTATIAIKKIIVQALMLLENGATSNEELKAKNLPKGNLRHQK